jgi:N-glycosylase/DNA lyase
MIPFNLEHTLNCGQLFRWKKLDDWWYGVVEDNVIKIKQIKERLIFHVAPENSNREFIIKYFRLDDDLSNILSKINRDEYMMEAIRLFSGLRLCRQTPWECLISYICATYKSIPAIKKMINAISQQFGKELTFDDYTFFTFPKPVDLAKVNPKELRRCGLGFRTERILETAKIVADGGFSFESLKSMEYFEAKKRLLDLSGVGQKVADCVLLFSLDKLEAFPIDVWMKRAITNFYASYFDSSFIQKIINRGSCTIKEYLKIGDFAREYFGRYAGYAQEYLFHLLRTQQKS